MMGCGRCGQPESTPAHTAHSLYYGDGQTTMLALFSMINWPCFQLSRFKRNGPIGPVFDDQLALFSVDKNTRGRKEKRTWRLCVFVVDFLARCSMILSESVWVSHILNTSYPLQCHSERSEESRSMSPGPFSSTKYEILRRYAPQNDTKEVGGLFKVLLTITRIPKKEPADTEDSPELLCSRPEGETHPGKSYGFLAGGGGTVHPPAYMR